MTTHMSPEQLNELKQDSTARKRWMEERKKQQALLYTRVLATKRGAVALADCAADDSREDGHRQHATIPPLAARCVFQLLLEHVVHAELDIRGVIRAACSCVSARDVLGELSQEFVVNYSRNIHLCQREDHQGCGQLQRITHHETVQVALVKYFAAWCPPARLRVATDAMYRLYQGHADAWSDEKVVPAVVMTQIHKALHSVRYAHCLRVERGIPSL